MDYRYIGSIPTDLEGGRPIAPGEFTGEIDVTDESPKHKAMVEEGLLIPVEPPPEPAETAKSGGKKEGDSKA